MLGVHRDHSSAVSLGAHVLLRLQSENHLCGGNPHLLVGAASTSPVETGRPSRAPAGAWGWRGETGDGVEGTIYVGLSSRSLGSLRLQRFVLWRARR